MAWQLTLVLLFASLIAMMMTGMPIFMAFLAVDFVGLILCFGEYGLQQFVLSITSSLSTFTLVPIPMFVLLGEVLFLTGIAGKVLDVLDEWLGRLPGRLGLLSMFAGTIFAALTGSSNASTALLGTMLVPEMDKQGYSKSMSLGPVLGSGGLAILIPPSSLAIMLAAIGEINVSRLLMAIIVPGILVAILGCIYIIGRCIINPNLAPAYEVKKVPLKKKLIDTAKYILPLFLILFSVIGVVLLGIATPSEAAACGTLAAFILAACYGKLNFKVIKLAIIDTIKNSAMILIIIAMSTTFSQILAYSGAAAGLTRWATSLNAAPLVVIGGMMVVVAIMGGFMSLTSIMLITLPIFLPVVKSLGFDTVWFGVIFLINIEMAMLTPPLGTNLYVMLGVAPKGTTIVEVIKAAVPFIIIDCLAIVLIMFIPDIALWLPSLMR